MKINEIAQSNIQNSTRMLAESLNSDPNSPFSKTQHEVIAESVIRAESSNNWTKFENVDSLMEWLNQNWK